MLQTGPICCEQLELFAKPKNSILDLDLDLDLIASSTIYR